MNPVLWITEAAALEADDAPLPPRADVVVVGAGVAGISTALWLARAGVSPLVLDAGTVAGRASGRNDGQMLLGLGEHYNRIVGQFGADRARSLWDFIRANNDGLRREIAAADLACDFVDAGGLRLAETAHEATELADAAALLAAEGHPHELLDRDALARVIPAAAGFFAGLRLPGEAIVQPVRLVRGLARLARDAGARIVERTPVVAVEPTDGGHVVVTAGGARLHATLVVHCTSTLARDLDVSGFLRAQVFPFRGQILATDPLPPALRTGFPPYAMSSNFCYEYFRVHADRFVVGGMRWSVPGEQVGILDDDGHDPRVTANLRDYVTRHFPTLAAVPFPHVWTGIMAGTSDGLPLLGPLPGSPGVFALLGFNGYGLSFAFAAGRALAEILIEGRAAHPAAPMFAPRRFA